jgi:hypothetical protein
VEIVNGILFLLAVIISIVSVAICNAIAFFCIATVFVCLCIMVVTPVAMYKMRKRRPEGQRWGNRGLGFMENGRELGKRTA